MKISADSLVDYIEQRKSKRNAGGEYECLFVDQHHTRPAMRFFIYMNETESADWRVTVESTIAAALADAEVGEKVFFELVN